MKKEKIVRLTKVIVDIMFCIGILIIITLPFTFKFAGAYVRDLANHYYTMLAIFGFGGIFGMVIVVQLRRMMKTVIQENCFVYENVKSLKIMGVTSIVLSLLFLMKMIMLPTPATVIIIIVFFVAGLFSFVLSCVFQEAVRYKEENDLTI